MSDTLKLANSIWPNGMKVDSDGHAVFYPLGTKKIKVPTLSSEWPKGDTLVSPFVYKDDKLVGFVDTKALKVFKNTAIYLPYEHIEAEFSAINKGQLQIHAPNATTKKASWKNSGMEDIPEAQYKYKGCTTVTDVNKLANYDYLADIANGTWSEPLWDLRHGNEMFNNCSTLRAFESDLPSLEGGYEMFANCANLTSFNSDLSSLTNGFNMFNYCENLSEFDTDLPNLTNGNEMFAWCTKLTTFYSDLPSLTNGEKMFISCTNLSEFSSDLSSLEDGYDMFQYCSNLYSFYSDLPSLTNGRFMFSRCGNLESFSSDLSSLTDGYYMFYYCTNLESFYSDLSSLTNGERMFYQCYNLTKFNSDSSGSPVNLSSLTNGYSMFAYSKLSSFSSDLSSLTEGDEMFKRCTNLTSFDSDLSSLEDGYDMFSGCKLDTASVQNIADTINTVTGWSSIDVGIGNSEPNEQEDAAFNKMASKGWTVYVNGSDEYTPTSPAAITTLDETGQEITTPIPFWAKPVQSDEEHAKYTDSEGNFFNILGAQFIYGDDLSTYGMFTCEADAAANMRLTPYIKPIEKQ